MVRAGATQGRRGEPTRCVTQAVLSLAGSQFPHLPSEPLKWVTWLFCVFGPGMVPDALSGAPASCPREPSQVGGI